MRTLKNIIKVDAGENGLQLVPGDIDGFHIQENTGKGKVYVYYCERQRLIKCLQRIG